MMSKGKIVLVSVASVWGLGVCIAGYNLYTAISERMDAEGLLLRANNKLGSYYSAKTFPSKKSIMDVKTNEVLYAKWTDLATILASRGGKTLTLESQTVFKQGLQNEVRRLVSLPGENEDQPLADSAFLFGFEKYLGESAALPLPNELPMLIRQLDFISRFTQTLSDAGATHLNLVARNLVARPDTSNHLEYTFIFTARPQPLVKTINALAAAPEFVVIDELKFVETADAIVARLNAEDSAREEAKRKKEKGKDGASSRSSRSRRRNNKKEEESSEQKLSDEELFAKMKQDRIVTDPEMNALFEVTLNVTVHNFGPDRYTETEGGGAAKSKAKEESKSEKKDDAKEAPKEKEESKAEKKAGAKEEPKAKDEAKAEKKADAKEESKAEIAKKPESTAGDSSKTVSKPGRDGVPSPSASDGKKTVGKVEKKPTKPVDGKEAK